MASSTKRVEARKRARAAKAKVDAKRAKRDTEISRAQTAFFVATADRDEAEASMVEAVRELSDDLELRAEDIAELCEISAAEVRAFKKRPATPAASTESAEDKGEGNSVT